MTLYDFNVFYFNVYRETFEIRKYIYKDGFNNNKLFSILLLLH